MAVEQKMMIPPEAFTLTKKVARSLYLSFNLLPSPVMQPMIIAFLLAKSCDTITDTVTIPSNVRKQALLNMQLIIKKEVNIEEAQRIIDVIQPYQTATNEIDLIQHLIQQFKWYNNLPLADKEYIASLLINMIAGMLLELDVFDSTDDVKSYPTVNDLEKFIYFEACVAGIYWTKSCYLHLQNYSTLDQETLIKLSQPFGRSLQIINIIRDIKKDYRDKKCFLPLDQLNAVQLSPENMFQHIEQLKPILKFWRKEAWLNLDDAIRYTLSVNYYRIRIACVLPILLGMKTLMLLNQTKYLESNDVIKIKRSDVYLFIFLSVICCLSKTMLQYLLLFLHKKYYREDQTK